MLTNVFSRSTLAHNISVGLTGDKARDILSSIQPTLPTEGSSWLSTKFGQHFKAVGSEGFCNAPTRGA